MCDAKHRTGRAGNSTAKQARTLGVLLLVTERCKMTATIISIEIASQNAYKQTQKQTIHVEDLLL